jgi:hypothetical protein
MKSTSILLLMIFAAANAAASDYEEVRELGLGSRGIDTLRVDNGSGYVEIVGVDGLDEISITATLVLEDTGAEKAKKIIESDLVRTLDENSDSVVLTAYFERKGLFNFGSSGLVNLDIRMPSRMHLDLDDGSGSIKIDGVHGDISVDDGSGSLALANVGGQVIIDDGSGSISARGVGGDLSINDGSGSIKVHDVAGSVTVDDGSGSINVQDVENDLIIVDDGSGSLDYSGISGDVITDS